MQSADEHSVNSRFLEAEQSLHSAIDKSQVMMLEVDIILAWIMDGHPLAPRLKKIQRNLLEQGELIYTARRLLNEVLPENVAVIQKSE